MALTSPLPQSSRFGARVAETQRHESVDGALLRLVRDAAKGDSEAFAALYRRYVPAVSHYAGAILRDPARTEDAVAQTFVELWQQLPKLREPQRFEAWMMRIAHNRAIDQTRRRPTELIDEAAGVAAPAHLQPEHATITNDVLASVRNALLALPDDQREAIVLRHLVGLRHEQIAEQMERSVEASRALLHRGMAALREAMTEAA